VVRICGVPAPDSGQSTTCSDGSTAYAYDIENRLVSASGARNAALSYDPLGRLYEVSSNGAPATRFLYDGDALVAEYMGGTMTRRHAHWAGADVPVATFEVPPGGGLGTVRHLFADHQGSIIAIGDGAGAIQSINRYDEYGIPGVGNTGRFQYTGQVWLAELGMYYYKARIYSPTLGRFLQIDPVGYEDQFNLYAYVGNDPVNRTDPTGTTCVEARSSWKCRVDNVDRSRLSTRQLAQLARFERRYSAAVNRLKSLPDRRILVRQSGLGLGAFTITRQEAGDNLIGREFSYEPGDIRAGPTATAHTSGSAGARNVVTHLTDRGLAIGNTVTAVHEGALHGSVQEASGRHNLAGLLGREPWRSGHQDPYRDASCQLLGGC
jgi:RHS repeat-associated protein